jgi:signal transduction histidine kinase
LRPRLLAALVATAAVTLAAAALALLAPLESQLRHNNKTLATSEANNAKAEFGNLQLVATKGGSYYDRLKAAADTFDDQNTLNTLIIWRRGHNGHVIRYVDTDQRRDERVSATQAIKAFAAPKRLFYGESGGLLSVTGRYRAQPPSGCSSCGENYVLQIFRPADYVGQANSVVRSAFLDAALVGLGVALLLGIALSSRLLRRLRLLQDASRSLDERDLGTLVVPHERVSDEIGELARAFATMHERLRQQEDARRAFVANASHELRTPLTSLDGMLELLADDLVADPIDIDDARARVAAAQLQSRRLRGLASDLLDLSRLDAAVELRSEPVELGETARAVAAEFDARARERHVSVTLDETGGQSWAQADPGSVARIVRILLDNALYVAPPDSTVSIQVGSNGAGTAISVSDEGPGVPESEREMIFQRFRRGQTRSDEGGFGLGLAIGSELAARMGGALELAEADGHGGATFRLRLRQVAG